ARGLPAATALSRFLATGSSRLGGMFWSTLDLLRLKSDGDGDDPGLRSPRLLERHPLQPPAASRQTGARPRCPAGVGSPGMCPVCAVHLRPTNDSQAYTSPWALSLVGEREVREAHA